MNNSRKPRQGVSPDSVSDKKSSKKTESSRPNKSQKSARPRYKIPQGFEGAGQFTSADRWFMEFLPALEERKLAEKNRKLQARRQRDAEHKKETRARRAELLAKVDGSSVTKKELRDILRRKGMRNDTGKLKEKTRYRWFGIFKIQGTEDQVKKAANVAGSDPRRVKITQETNGTWSAVFPRFFQHGTPTQAEAFLPGHAEQGISDFEASGASLVEYLGAVWQEIPLKKKGGK